MSDLREPFSSERREVGATTKSGDSAQHTTRAPAFSWKWRITRDASVGLRTAARTIRVPVDGLSTRASAPRVTIPPPSLAPHELTVQRANRASTVVAFLGFVLGFAVALAGIEWMHRASLTAMRDAAMLRDPARP